MTTMTEKNWKRIVSRVGGFLGHHPHATGIDIGSRSIKTIVLQTAQKKISVQDFSIQPTIPITPQGVPPDPKGSTIQGLKDQLAGSLGDVGMAISGPQVLLRSLPLPAMANEDLREHVRLEIDRYISLDLQDILWDVYHGKTLHVTNGEKEENFLVVAKKEYIENWLNLFRQHGIDVCFVDVDAFALVNMLTVNYGSDVSSLLVHLGPTGVLVVNVEAGEPSCIRQFSYGAEWYGDFLDQLFLTNNFPNQGGESGVSQAMLLEQFITETSSHLLETLKSFSEKSMKPACNSIFLSGGYSRVPDLPERLSASLQIPVSLVNPFRTIGVPTKLQEDQVFNKPFLL